MYYNISRPANRISVNRQKCDYIGYGAGLWHIVRADGKVGRPYRERDKTARWQAVYQGKEAIVYFADTLKEISAKIAEFENQFRLG